MSIPNFDDPCYSLSAVAKATGWNLQTLRDYVAKGFFEWQDGDQPATVAGRASRLPVRSVLRLGITFELWQLGISPREAFQASIGFCDLGSPAGGSKHGQRRAAGELFPEPYETVLLFKKGHKSVTIPVLRGESIDLDEIMSDPFNGSAGAVALVRVNSVWQRIIAALDIEG